MAGMVECRIVRIDDDDQRVCVALPVQVAQHRRKAITYRWPAAPMYAARLDLLGGCAEDSFDEDGELHFSAGTPPRMPVYQASPRLTSRRISSTSMRSTRRSNFASAPSLCVMTISSGRSRKRSSMYGECVVMTTCVGWRSSPKFSG